MYKEAVRVWGEYKEFKYATFTMALMVFGLVIGVIGVWEAMFPKHAIAHEPSVPEGP